MSVSVKYTLKSRQCCPVCFAVRRVYLIVGHNDIGIQSCILRGRNAGLYLCQEFFKILLGVYHIIAFIIGKFRIKLALCNIYALRIENVKFLPVVTVNGSIYGISLRAHDNKVFLARTVKIRCADLGIACHFCKCFLPLVGVKHIYIKTRRLDIVPAAYLFGNAVFCIYYLHAAKVKRIAAVILRFCGRRNGIYAVCPGNYRIKSRIFYICAVICGNVKFAVHRFYHDRTRAVNIDTFTAFSRIYHMIRHL